MKKIIYILLLLPLLAISQNGSQNYVKTTVYKQATPYTAGQEPSANAQKQEQVTYLDGLGRPIQQVTGKASPDQKDIITHIKYDIYGRQPKEYLPYKAGTDNLDYNSNAALDVINFYNTPYYENTTNPYTEKFFDVSPLKKVTKQGAPGIPWKGNTDNDNDHTVKFSYVFNTEADAVKRFTAIHPYETFPNGYFNTLIEKTELTNLYYNGLYLKNQLYKNIVKDENWTPADGVNKTTEEFKDPLGRIILKRNYNAGQKHDTYYVYDRFSNLSYVIPPLASDNITYAGTLTPVFGGRAYPWVAIVSVDRQLADDYNRALMDYENAEILNVDLIDKYGGQGGFAITQDETGNLSISYNVTTTQPMELRLGEIMSLNEYGHFEDKELGRIKGSGYEYYFLIKNNALYIDGHGKVPSLTAGFTGGNPLAYTKNYAWTTLYNADPNVAKNYDAAIAGLANSDILTTYTANPYNATGGISVSLDEQDNLTLSVNMTSNTTMALKTGVLIPFDFKRRITDRDMGTLTIDGAAYTFTVKDNALEVRGAGVVSNISYTNIIGASLKTQVRDEAVEGLCYIYHYDKRNRLIEKKIPGKQWEYIIYDKRDRVVLTGPAFNPFNGNNEGWIHTLYDNHDRPSLTGWFPETAAFNTPARIAKQNNANFTDIHNLTRDNTNTEHIYYILTGYTLPAAFTLPADYGLLTINYYDTYGFPGHEAFPSQPGLGSAILPAIKGQATGSFTRILKEPLSSYSIISYTGYDVKGRPIYSRSVNNYFTSETVVNSTLDFTGKLLSTITTKKYANLPNLTVYDTYTYDHADRLLRHRQGQTSPFIFGNVQHIIANNEYDALGQLKKKDVGARTNSTTPLQTIDYTYNIRGWLKTINDVNNALQGTPDLFAFKLHYDTKDETSSVGLYNGNIAESIWRSRTDDAKRIYSYRYDNLNRLTDALYFQAGANTRYDEKGITYDKNGNIQTLIRRGLKQQTPTVQYDNIDVLGYNYPLYSNRLENVKDTAGTAGFIDGNVTGSNGAATADYIYDANGNMIRDYNKGLATYSTKGITYNHLNLPVIVPINNGNTQDIQYLYDATGAKLQKTVTYNKPKPNEVYTITQYDNGFVYEYSQVAPSLPVLQFYSHPEGYVKVGPTTTNSRGDQVYTDFTYVYQYKDHLGNVRLSYQGTDDITENATGTAPTGFVSTSNGGTISTVTYNNIPQVRVGVQAAWSGGGKKLDNAATVAGTAYKLTLTLDKGTVAGNLNIKIGEQGASGSGLYNEIYNGTITTSGTYTIDFVTPGINPNLYVRIDKGDGALSSVRYFYVSKVKVERKGVSVVEEDNYYAFGMKHKGYNTNVQPNANTAAQRYKYNDKEFQDELNLNWYDYHARNYDPALGRWFNIDPLAEKSRRFSPYTYTLNNPVYFIDPDGMEAEASGGGGMSDELDENTEIEIDAGYGRKVTAKNRTMSMVASADLSDGKNGKVAQNLYKKEIVTELDKQIDKAYGSKADSAAPREESTITNAIENIPILKRIYSKIKDYLEAPGIIVSDKYSGPKGAEAITRTWYDNPFGKPYMVFFGSAFDSYREVSHTILHEFGHATSFITGNFYMNYIRNGNYWEKTVWQDETYAYWFAYNNGGRMPTHYNKFLQYFENHATVRPNINIDRKFK